MSSICVTDIFSYHMLLIQCDTNTLCHLYLVLPYSVSTIPCQVSCVPGIPCVTYPLCHLSLVNCMGRGSPQVSHRYGYRYENPDLWKTHAHSHGYRFFQKFNI